MSACGPSISRILNSAILTTYFTSRPDPQRRTQVEPDSAAFIEPWYRSVVALGIHGVIFHDGLSEGFVKEYSTPRVKFIKVSCQYSMSTNDHRFFVYRHYLAQTPLDAVFLTDVSDVSIVQDPFRNVDEGVLFVGRDEPQRIAESLWIQQASRAVGIRRVDWQLRTVGGQPLCNAGVIGGGVKVVKTLLEHMCGLFSRINRPELNLNMLVFNIVAHTVFRGRLNNCLTSNFKRYETGRRDVVFIHK